ncbi:hypothetical protein [Comamonas jiangduensis]|uniref:hypothetical protein n=1 Tax=Comamonas jiangduensis TaxID=1194168 RepID=UPI0024E14732|nr:hypothetical protein [Comamonas jiangduensis]
MATSAPMRRSLVDQIPTEEDRQAPAARPQSGIHASEFGRQAYNTAMALPGIGGVGKVAQTGGLVSRALNSTAGVVNKVATGTAALAVLPAGAESPESTPAIPRTSAAGAARGTVNPPTAGASNPLVDASRQVAPGIYRTGNSYAGTGEAAVSLNSEPKGMLSAQNMAAAEQLSANQQMDSISRVATSDNVPQSPPQGLIGRVTATHSGNDWTAREMLRRQKMDANSLIHQSHWAKKGSGQAAQKAYGEALQADFAAMTGGQTGADVEVMRQNAGLQREGIQQAGADRREGRRSLIDAARLGMEQETQGFANRAAGQQEQLRNTLLDPKATPEQRAMAQRSLAALAGKTAADRMQTVTLPDTTNDMGQVVRGGQALVRLMEDGSVQQVPVSASQPTGASSSVQREVGTVSRVGNKEAVWDGSKWVPR